MIIYALMKYYQSRWYDIFVGARAPDVISCHSSMDKVQEAYMAYCDKRENYVDEDGGYIGIRRFMLDPKADGTVIYGTVK